MIVRWNDEEHSITVDLCVYRVVEVNGKVDVYCVLSNSRILNVSKGYINEVNALVDKIIDDATQNLIWEADMKDALINGLKSSAKAKVDAICK